MGIHEHMEDKRRGRWTVKKTLRIDNAARHGLNPDLIDLVISQIGQNNLI